MALKPGERINLIREIGRNLEGEKWSDLTLILDTFSISDLGEYEDWSDTYDYILRRLRSADDDALAALYEHAFPNAPAIDETGVPVAGPWKDGYFRLFLSHTNASKQLAGKVRERLMERGVDAYVAHDMIEPTKEWMDEIDLALRTCDATAAILSEDFVESAWCDQEIGISIGRRVLIVAIRQGADPHGFISKYQAVPGDATPLAPEKIAEGVYAVLVAHDQTKGKMAEAIISRYAVSDSFDDARANLARVKEIEDVHWTDDMIAVVEKAGAENVDLRKGDWYGQPIPAALRDHLNDLLDREPAPNAGTNASDDIPF